MGRRDHEEEDEDDLDPEGPDESEIGDSDDEAIDTEPCPICGRMISAQADLCPHCGNFVAMEEVREKRPLWVWVGLGLCLLVAILWGIFG